MTGASSGKRGFTLIELLIAASIAALIAVAIAATFAGGLNVYNRVLNYNDIRPDVLLALERIESDLKNACNISEIEFKGEGAKVTFPALVNATLNAKLATMPGSVSYYVDDLTHYLVREEKDYSAAASKIETGKGLVTNLAPADKVKFQYYYYDSKAAVYRWSDTWVREEEEALAIDASRLGAAKDKPLTKKLHVNSPLGIKIEIQCDSRSGPFTLTRTVFFPLAVSLRLAESAAEKEAKAKAVKE